MAIAATPTAAQSKRGVPFNETASLASFENTQAISWCWNWAASVPEGQTTGNLTYVPMLVGVDAQFTNTWQQEAQQGINDGSDYLSKANILILKVLNIVSID